MSWPPSTTFPEVVLEVPVVLEVSVALEVPAVPVDTVVREVATHRPLRLTTAILADLAPEVIRAGLAGWVTWVVKVTVD